MLAAILIELIKSKFTNPLPILQPAQVKTPLFLLKIQQIQRIFTFLLENFGMHLFNFQIPQIGLICSVYIMQVYLIQINQKTSHIHKFKLYFRISRAQKNTFTAEKGGASRALLPSEGVTRPLRAYAQPRLYSQSEGLHRCSYPGRACSRQRFRR